MTAPQIDDAPPFDAFSAGLARQTLLLQRCDTCGTVQLGHIRCDACLGASLAWIASSAKGSIFSFVVMHRAYHAAFADRLPYPVGVVELAEGPRIVAGFAVERKRLHAGLRVRVAWDRSGSVAPICFVEDTV